MELLVYILIYFIIIIFLLKSIRLIVLIYIKRDYELEKIKLNIWKIIGILIVFFTLLLLFLILNYFELINFQYLF